MNIKRRLNNLARNSRFNLGITILAGALGGILTIGQARNLSWAVSRVFLEGQSLMQVTDILRMLLFIIAGRSFLMWISEVSAKAVAVHVKNDLRERLFSHIYKLGPAYTRRERTGELTATAVEGIEALDAYFSQYLPQLALSALIPLSILIFAIQIDPLSALVLFLTAPLIPVFMIMIGKAAEALTHQQYETLTRLSAHFLDSLQGLTTLKYFGRSKDHARSIEEVSNEFRDTTMNVLRVTFLSALVLELVATLSTAVIAVEIGLRLLYAKIAFEQALFLLILAPEFYLPFRNLGLRFHAGMNGTTAARKIFEILDLPVADKLKKTDENQNTSLLPDGNIQITIKDLTFTYPDETSPALEDINLNIEAGQHFALVGESGAGKSTLVQLLLRFISPNDGQILAGGQPLENISIENWREKIAWVPQNPFIFNTSLADNIRLGQPDADMDAVKTAARTAHLDDFIKTLPEGYQTVVGEGGARLSSGQAQRLALARAFLKDAPILILDEPTSSLDPTTETELEEATRKLSTGRTVITIAHRMNTIFRADRIVVLKSGRIVESGTHKELLAQKGVYSQMVQTQNYEIADELKIPLVSPKLQVQRNIPEVKQSQPKNTIFRLLSFLNGSWGRVALSVLIGAATIASSLSLIGVSSWLISAAALHPSIAELQLAIVGVRFFGISRGVFRYLERLVSHDVTFRLLSRIRAWFYRSIEPLAPARLMFYRSGDLLSRVISDIDTLENFYIRVVSPPLVAIVISLGAVGYLGHYEARLGWALLAFLFGLGVVVPILIDILSKKLGGELVYFRTELHSQLVDGIQGVADLLAFGRSADRQKDIVRVGEAYGRIQQKMAWITGFHSGLGVLLTNLGMWTVLSLGIIAVNTGAIPGVMLAALTMIALVSFEAVASLPQAAQMFGESTESARQLFEIVDAKPEVEWSEEQEREDEHWWADGDFSATIQFSDLSFTYPGNQEPALKNIDFTLSEGRSIAIVGPSGAGKSTIANLLLRFWDFHAGEISISGHSVRTFAPDVVRSQIAVIPQQPYFFNASIRDNLNLARPDASQSEIETAAQQAKIHDFITQLPDGYDTYIHEGGLRLSGGERQRLAIARALLKDAPIIILDEPTANLDPITEGQVLETIYSLMGGQTFEGKARSTLLITHRLVGLELVDEIIVLDNGEIVERGNQADLLRKKGFYSQMFILQNRILEGNY